jgi:4-amino-4-deoxy-L-arabinose transferase-like glycosyltransferase
MPAELPSRRKIDIVCLALVLVVGIFLRLPHSTFSGGSNPLHLLESAHLHSKVDALGFDEGLYRGYLITLIDGGLPSYPQIVEHYIELQGRLPKPILPPVRFLYIFSGYIWHSCFGTEALASLNAVSSLFTILTLVLSGIFAYRLAGRAAAIAVTALMAFAPTQIHMSQHALIDGFFTFWAVLSLWLLWENLRAPRDWRWLGAYACALALLVLTKENSFFVWVALLAVMVANRWLQFGKVTRELFVATVIGPIFGVVVLILLAGGLHNLIATYQLLVGKASNAAYAVLTGDGPWYRYLVDLFLVSPIVLVLALGALFRLNRTMKPELFLSVFIAASYLVMCNVKYGMNLRYANMWDMPLRFLAFSQIGALMQLSSRYKGILIAAAVAIVAAIEFRQYYILAVQYPLYELITHELLRALNILKIPPH